MIGADEDGKVRVYMCLTDADCELGLANCVHAVYPSAEMLREKMPCVAQCGIAKVAIEIEEIIQEPDYAGAEK